MPTPRSARSCSSTRWSIPKASLTLLSELMNYDFSGLALDAPITDELIGSVSGIRGLVQNLKKHIGGDTVTLADLAGHRATLLQGPRFVGTGPEVADQMEEWIEADACDGFVIAATHCPGAYEDVVRLVVPELQRRGVFRDRYTGETLRDTLGLARPDVGAPCLKPPVPLDGMRVVDAATLAAGPLVATAMGEFGADVIKVEQPGAGDPLRTWGDRKDEIGLVWKSMSRNKRCVTLDLRQRRRPGSLPPTSSSQRRAGRQQPAERRWPGGASTTSRCTTATPSSSCST